MINHFFKDLKVVELASVLAGPAVGMFFAELGAKVIKIENKTTGGDMTRQWRLPGESPEKAFSAYYCSVNWHKEVMLMDLTQAEDRQTVLREIADADVVISNFKESAALNLGMHYSQLIQINPKLVFAQLYSYKENEERPAFDVVLQAEAGFMYMNGEPDGDPVKMPVALIDLLAAHQLKEAVLLGLLHRERTGAGCFVSASLFESAVASLANQATNWLMEGAIPQRMGTRHPNIAPYGDVYRTRDQKAIVLAVGTEKQFRQLCQVLDVPQLASDPKYANNLTRVQNRESLNSHLQNAIFQWDKNTLLDTLEAAYVPAAGINNMEEVFELAEAKKMILEEEMEDGSISKRVKTAIMEIKV